MTAVVNGTTFRGVMCNPVVALVQMSRLEQIDQRTHAETSDGYLQCSMPGGVPKFSWCDPRHAGCSGGTHVENGPQCDNLADLMAFAKERYA